MSSRVKRMVLRVLLYGGALFVVLPFVFSYLMTRTYRQRFSAGPARGYEAVTIDSEGLRLRAWLFRGRPDRPPVVIAHGLGDMLDSYQEHAAFFIDRGHGVLLFDFRGHGGSEGSHTTLGGRESEDVRAALRYLRERGLGGEGFILVGHSMGAVAVLLAAGSQPDVRAVIVEAPYDSFRNTVAHHAKLLYGLPSWVPIIPLAILGAEWIAGFDADEVDCVAAAEAIEAPLLAIVDGDDPRMPEPVVKRILDAHSGPHALWIADGVGHVGAIFHPEWRHEIRSFLDRHGL